MFYTRPHKHLCFKYVSSLKFELLLLSPGRVLKCSSFFFGSTSSLTLIDKFPHMSNTPYLSQMEISGVRSCPMDRWRKCRDISKSNQQRNCFHVNQVMSDGQMEKKQSNQWMNWFHVNQAVSNGPIDKLTPSESGRVRWTDRWTDSMWIRWYPMMDELLNFQLNCAQTDWLQHLQIFDTCLCWKRIIKRTRNLRISAVSRSEITYATENGLFTSFQKVTGVITATKHTYNQELTFYWWNISWNSVLKQPSMRTAN